MWKPVNERFENEQALNKLAYEIRGAFFEVFKAFGPGLTENIYEAATVRELQRRGLSVQRQVPVDVYYKGEPLDISYRLDLLIEDEIIVELKSVEQVAPVHFKQVLTYLKLKQKRLGYLVNFNSELLKDQKSVFRIINKV
jgi:GxxExxY protein